MTALRPSHCLSRRQARPETAGQFEMYLMEGSLSSICLICGLTDAAASTEDRSISGLLSSCCMACCHIGFCTQGTSASHSRDARRQEVYRVAALPTAKSAYRHSKMYLEAACDENPAKTYSHICSVHRTSIFCPLSSLQERHAYLEVACEVCWSRHPKHASSWRATHASS